MSGKVNDWIKTHKVQTAFVALAAVAAVGLGVFALLRSGFLGVPAPGEAAAAPGESDTASEASVSFTVNVDEGWTQESTPVVVHMEGTGAAEGKETYHALVPPGTGDGDAAPDTVRVPTGTYRVDLISPIDADGSIYEVGAPQDVDASGTGASADVSVTLKRIPADQVTEEQLQALIERLEEAVAKGDGTLSGGAGGKVLEQARRRLEEKRASAEDDKALEEAVRKARDEGLNVLTGTVHVLATDGELAALQGVEDLDGPDYDAGPYVVLKLDQPTGVEAGSVSAPSFELGRAVRTATFVRLLGGSEQGNASRWARYDGKRVTVAISPRDLWRPSDVSLPHGQPFLAKGGTVRLLSPSPDADEGIVGTFSYVAPAGGFRGSVKIDSATHAVLTRWHSLSPDVEKVEYEVRRDGSVSVPEGFVAYRFTPVSRRDGEEDWIFAYNPTTDEFMWVYDDMRIEWARVE